MEVKEGMTKGISLNPKETLHFVQGVIVITSHYSGQLSAVSKPLSPNSLPPGGERAEVFKLVFCIWALFEIWFLVFGISPSGSIL
jgi:hypothetical protein